MQQLTTLALAFAWLFSCTSTRGSELNDRVTLTTGVVEGLKRADGLRVFKGIPFATPPVGDLRWKPPQPLAAWAGVKQAKAFGPSPMQHSLAAGLLGVPAPFSEDCLYLNIWSPAKTDDERLPVMVWIHGGAFAIGSTSQPLYDGARLANKGVIVVSVGYRVGVFGFLAHPDLTAEGGGVSGNYGLRDQIAGLQWVRDNIAAFGGDPMCVTIFGESAGAHSVCALTAAPKAKGLFHRAIAESGGMFAAPKMENELGTVLLTRATAEVEGKQFLDQLGAGDLAAARKLTASALIKANPELVQAMAGGAPGTSPIVDGEVLPDDIYRLYAAGNFNDVPILIGTNSDEIGGLINGAVSPEKFKADVQEKTGAAAEAVLAAYPHADGDEALQSTKTLLNDVTFNWHTWKWASLKSKKGKANVFVYRFNYRGKNHKSGVPHAAELQYVFHNLPTTWWNKPTAADEKMADTMGNYWVNFAKTGAPSGNGLPTWTPFTSADPSAMHLDGKPKMQPLPGIENLRALDRYFSGLRKRGKRNQ